MNMQENGLDRKDRRLIAALDEDARQSITAIARKAGLSKQSAAYRLDRLAREGILTNALAIVDLPALGCTGFQVYFKLRGLPRRKEAPLVKFLKGHPRVVWAIRCTGSWDLLVLFAERSPQEFQEDLKQFLSVFGPFIAQKAVSIYLVWEHLNHKYLTGEEPKGHLLGKRKQVLELDQTDGKILFALATEARKTVAEISRETAIPASTVFLRLKQLRKRGVIAGFAPLLDFQKTGRQYYHVLLKLHGEPERASGLKSFLAALENVAYLVECVGEADLEIEVHARNAMDLQQFLLDLRGRFGDLIERDEAALVFNVIKYSYYPFKDIVGT